MTKVKVAAKLPHLQWSIESVTYLDVYAVGGWRASPMDY